MASLPIATHERDQTVTMSPQQSCSRRLASGAGVGALILGVTALVYLPVLQAGFVWDDDMVHGNPAVQSGSGLARIWSGADQPDYFPLTLTSFWLEWRLWGRSPAGFHGTNAALHGLAAVLLWLVLRRLGVPGAALAGLVFAAHPVNVASAAWIAERKNTLAMVFYLLAGLAYVRFDDRGRRGWYVAALTAFALALLSKTSVVMFPFVLLGLAWWRRGRIGRGDWVRAVPFLVLAAAFGFVTVRFQHTRAMAGEDPSVAGPLWGLAAWGRAVWFYGAKALVPVRLSMVYPRWVLDLTRPSAYGPTLALAAALAALSTRRGRWPRAVVAALGYTTVMLLPVLGFAGMYFMKFSFVADHWQYVSIAGAIGLAAAAFSGRVGRKGWAMAWVAALAALALQQTFSYRDQTTLWRRTVNENPRAWVGWNNLAAAGVDAGRLNEAMAHCRRALRLRPNYAKPYFVSGTAHAKAGRLSDAARDFSRAIQIRPDLADAYYSRGLVFRDLRQYDRAIADYTRAVRSDPRHAQAYSSRGIAYGDQGRLDLAIGDLTRAIELAPGRAAFRLNRAVAFARMGDRSRALADVEAARRLGHEVAPAFVAELERSAARSAARPPARATTR